jgi:hypothetical protein
VFHADIFSDQSMEKAEAQPGKFQFNTAIMKGLDQPPLQKIRHADAVEPDERANQRDRRDHRRAAGPADEQATFAPETGLHITGRLPE